MHCDFIGLCEKSVVQNEGISCVSTAYLMFYIYNKSTDFAETWFWGRLYTWIDQISWDF
jgi:hypothetical protein